MYQLLESLDEIYPFQRVESKIKTSIYDIWEFENETNTHVVRFVRGDASQFGKRVSLVEFGIKRGKHVRKDIAGVPNIRKYIATVSKIIESALEDPTRELKQKRDGLVILIKNEVYEKIGNRFKRIIYRLMRPYYRIHNSYNETPLKDMNAVYTWKISKQFDSVFPGLEDYSPVDDGMANPESDKSDKPISSLKSFSNFTKETEVDYNEIETASNYTTDVFNNEEDLEEPATLYQKKEKAKQLGGQDLRELKNTSDSYLETIIAVNFFSSNIKNLPSYLAYSDNTSLGDKKISLSEDTINKYFSSVLKKDTHILSEYEYLLALNIHGIKTAHMYDLHDGSESSINRSYGLMGVLLSMGFTSETVKNILSKTKTNTTWEEILEICRNAKQILDSYNIVFDNKKHTPIKLKFTPGTVFSLLNNKDEQKNIIYNVLSTLDDEDIKNAKFFEYADSSKETKQVKKLNYNAFTSDSSLGITQSLASSVKSIVETPEEFIEMYDMFPEFAKSDLLHNDLEFFEIDFINSWTIAGSNWAQYVAHKTASDFEINEQLNDFWNAQADKNEGTIIDQVYELKKNDIQNNFDALYQRSQQFFKEKFGKKYETKTIKLYRGVGAKVVDTYIPGALESWTTAISTAKKFASMMSKGNEDYTILYAEVPIQHIFGSYESFKETWPGEEHLKGKKEYIVMGGTFASTPLYQYDLHNKQPVNTLKTFNEWLILEGNNMDKKQVKIVTPSMKDFKKIINKKTTAKGNDPEENKIRNSNIKKGE